MIRFVARAEALLLIAMGALGLWFSAAESYTRLMSPDFRWLTAAGGALIVAMGAALLARPRAHPRPATAVVPGSFMAFAVAAVGAAGRGQLLVAPEVEAAESRREGYELVEADRFVEGFTEEVGVPDGARVAVTGFVRRTEALDAAGHYALLRPPMACCVADALALGVQVDGAADRMPDEGEWVTVFATARVASRPIETPPFRVGPILFTVVSRTHVLSADEAVPVRSLCPTSSAGSRPNAARPSWGLWRQPGL